MVKEITAWQDSSGTVHSTRLQAARADAKILLEKILGKDNQAFINIVMQNPERFHEALSTLVSELKLQPKPDMTGEVAEGALR